MGIKNTISRVSKSSGFTLIELVVVIAVLGILVTIVSVSYPQWQQQLAVTKLTSDLNGARAAMDNHRNFHSGYPSSVSSIFTASPDNTLTTTVNGEDYCIVAVNSKYPSMPYHFDTTDRSHGVMSGLCLANPAVSMSFTRYGIRGLPDKVYFSVVLPAGISANQCKYKVEKPSYPGGNPPSNPVYAIYNGFNDNTLNALTNNLIFDRLSSPSIHTWNDTWSDPEGYWDYHNELRVTVKCDYYGTNEFKKVGQASVDIIYSD